MIGNNPSQLGVSVSQLASALNTQSFAPNWMPTTSEFDFNETFGDYDYHQKVATRLGAHHTHSREDKKSQPGTNTIENSHVRLTDGSIVFTSDLFGPGIRGDKVNCDMTSVDGGVKHKGLALEAEYYWRWLSNFTGTNTGGIADIDDHGSRVQSSAMVVPKALQVYLSSSAIRYRILGQIKNVRECVTNSTILDTIASRTGGVLNCIELQELPGDFLLKARSQAGLRRRASNGAEKKVCNVGGFFIISDSCSDPWAFLLPISHPGHGGRTRDRCLGDHPVSHSGQELARGRPQQRPPLRHRGLRNELPERSQLRGCQRLRRIELLEHCIHVRSCTPRARERGLQQLPLRPGGGKLSGPRSATFSTLSSKPTAGSTTGRPGFPQIIKLQPSQAPLKATFASFTTVGCMSPGVITAHRHLRGRSRAPDLSIWTLSEGRTVAGCLQRL